MKKRVGPLPVIFTDLDGTLLDHHNYGFFPAIKAIKRIKTQQIPLIINSSKTRPEILAVQQALEIRQPFICENGAALYMPLNSDNKWQCHDFSTSREKILSVLHQLRKEYNFQFTGFNDCSAEEIAKLTGLTPDQSALARQREFTEPLKWLDSQQKLIDFTNLLAEKNLRALQGGRFLSIMGQCDKAEAMRWLMTHFRKKQQKKNQGKQELVTIALGDGPNDQQMLESADIAVIIHSNYSDTIELQSPRRIIRTTLPGPEGWQWAMDQILDQLKRSQLKN